MKAKHLGIMAMLALMLVSCGGKLPAGKNLSELKDPTTADTIANLLGQYQAMTYWHLSANDTVLNTDDGRDEYIKGFIKGMEIVSANDQYNVGLRNGMDAALQLKAINKDFEINTTHSKYLEGMAYGMKNDSIVNQQDLQMTLNQVGSRLDAEKKQRDKIAAEKALDELVAKEKLTKKGNYAYKMVKKGNGEPVGEGTFVKLDFSVKDNNGKDLIPSMGALPIEVGAPGLPQQIAEVLANMTPGSEAVVYASMNELGLQRNGDATSMAKVTLNIESLCDETGAPVTEPVKGPVAKAREEKAEQLQKTVVNVPAPQKPQVVVPKK